MSDYGRNFEFRITPKASARSGRYSVPGTGSRLPIGVPIVVDTTKTLTDGLGLQPVKLAPHSTSRGAGDAKGIAVYEYGPAAFAGDDPMLTTSSDKDTIPLGAAVQMIRGDDATKVCFTNTVARQFLGQRSYPGRKMVSGIGATPLVAVGDFLIPGLGNDTDGYWEATADGDAGWLEITLVDAVRAQVEARMLF